MIRDILILKFDQNLGSCHGSWLLLPLYKVQYFLCLAILDVPISTWVLNLHSIFTRERSLRVNHVKWWQGFNKSWNAKIRRTNFWTCLGLFIIFPLCVTFDLSYYRSNLSYDDLTLPLWIQLLICWSIFWSFDQTFDLLTNFWSVDPIFDLLFQFLTCWSNFWSVHLTFDLLI